MVSDGSCGLFRMDGPVREIEAGFVRGLPLAGGGLEFEYVALDAEDGGDVGLPLRERDDRLAIEDGDATGFVAVAPFLVDDLVGGGGDGVGAAGFDPLTQLFLIGFQLDDEMGVGVGVSGDVECLSSKHISCPLGLSKGVHQIEATSVRRPCGRRRRYCWAGN